MVQRDRIIDPFVDETALTRTVSTEALSIPTRTDALTDTTACHTVDLKIRVLLHRQSTRLIENDMHGTGDLIDLVVCPVKRERHYLSLGTDHRHGVIEFRVIEQCFQTDVAHAEKLFRFFLISEGIVSFDFSRDDRIIALTASTLPLPVQLSHVLQSQLELLHRPDLLSLFHSNGRFAEILDRL